MMTAAELKQARANLGMTQKSLTETLNTPLKTYQKWEQGTRRVPGIVPAALLLLVHAGLKNTPVDKIIRALDKLKSPPTAPAK